MSRQEQLTNRYLSLNSLAHRQCNDALYAQALMTYRTCLKLAQELGDVDKIAASRSWIGECLRKLDRHAEALVVLAPNLSKYARGNAKELYNSMTTYIGIALELPASKDIIRDAIDEARAYLTRIGRLDWQHSLLLLESIYWEEQGLLDKAVDASEQAWSIWKQRYPYFTADSHFFQMIFTKLKLKHIDDAKRILHEWECNAADTHPTTRISQMCQIWSFVHRCEGNFQASIEFAQRALDYARQLEVPRDLAATQIALSYAHMLALHFEQAKQVIVQIPSKILKQKKAYILGDYHLLLARSLCGLAAVDISFEDAFPQLPESITGSDAIWHELRRARYFYEIAMKRARYCDEAFDCSWRVETLRRCLEHIQALEKAIEVRKS